MKQRLLVALVVLLAGIRPLAAEDAQRVPSIALPPELDRVLRDYEKAWSSRDAGALAQLFTEDGFVLSNGEPPVRGRDSVRKAYTGKGGPLALRAFAYSVDGSTGYMIGAYSGAKDQPDFGKFILALRKVDGRWLIAADIDNVNSPPRREPAAAPAH